MNPDAVPVLDFADLTRLGTRPDGSSPPLLPSPECPVCAPLRCLGWESLPPAFEAAGLVRVGTLRLPGEDEPTLAEWHPSGTHAWSPEAPIAPHWFPYNRCDVWRCVTCARAFLRYTEYGGYYVDERIRELDVARLIDAPMPPPG